MKVTGVRINTERGLLKASIPEDNGEETPLQAFSRSICTRCPFCQGKVVVDHSHGDDDSDVDDRVVMEFSSELFNITAADDLHAFTELMKSLDDYEEMLRYSTEGQELDICPLAVFRCICRNAAIDCGTALLEGESGVILDLKVNPKLGYCPLHLAADQMFYEMIDLLLLNGAQTDLKSKETLIVNGGLLPLSVALEKLRYHESLYDWSPKDSVIKLITKLCLPNMKIPLEVNRLLALNTERVDDIFYCYSMEGKLVEMAVLLMVAREKVIAGFGGNMDIRQHLLEEIASITHDEIKLMGCRKGGKWVPVFKDKKLAMKSALELLEIFERAGDCIGAYVQSVQCEMTEQEAVKGIIFLLEENGFILKSEDIHFCNIDCAPYNESGKTKLDLRISEKRTDFGYPFQDLGMPALSPLTHSYAEKNPDTNKMKGTKVALSPMRFFRSGPETSPLMKNFPLMLHYYSLPPAKQKAAREKSLQNLLTAKTHGRFALLIKRGIRHI